MRPLKGNTKKPKPVKHVDLKTDKAKNDEEERKRKKDSTYEHVKQHAYANPWLWISTILMLVLGGFAAYRGYGYAKKADGTLTFSFLGWLRDFAIRLRTPKQVQSSSS
jgi:hypothetical protein